MGKVICFRGVLDGNGSQEDVQLRWRVIHEGKTVCADKFSSKSSVDSSCVVWVKSQEKGEYYIEIYYFLDGEAQVIGRYDYELY